MDKGILAVEVLPNNNSILLLLIIAIVIFETMAISCVKEYHISNKTCYFCYAVILYGIVCYLLHQSFYFTTMGMTNVIWSGLSVFMVTIFGVLFFKERVHMHDILAGCLITAGIIIFKVTN